MQTSLSDQEAYVHAVPSKVPSAEFKKGQRRALVTWVTGLVDNRWTDSVGKFLWVRVTKND